jgi:hypothetical protein
MNQGQETGSAVADAELVEMLIDQPELLAIADALRATRSEPVTVVQRRRRLTGRGVASAAGVATAIAATVALLLASPWAGSPSFTQKALAAVDGGPVVHVVVTSPASVGGPVIDISTGKTIPRIQQTEIWFDGERDLTKTVQALDGRVVDEVLETPQGGWTQAGPIITCSWIAAHPVEATRLRVSCNANGENGTTPRTIPETRPPPLDPALAGFVDHYRSALASGAAREVGRGDYGGHDVVWLEFATNGRTERVAVDAHSYKPLAIEEAELTLRVLEAEAVPFSPELFTKPAAIETQRGSTVTSSRELSPKAAASLLGGRALWLGQSWNGLVLTATTLEERSIGYGPGRELAQAEVVRFTYAPGTATGTPDTESRIDIYESTSCVLSVGWQCNARDPAGPGELKGFGLISLLRSDGLYVSTWNFMDRHASLDLARGLIPLSG